MGIPTQANYKKLGIKRLKVIVNNLQKKNPWDLPMNNPVRLKWVRASNALGILLAKENIQTQLKHIGKRQETRSGKTKGRVSQSLLAKLRYSSC